MTGVQTCALPILRRAGPGPAHPARERRRVLGRPVRPGVLTGGDLHAPPGPGPQPRAEYYCIFAFRIKYIGKMFFHAPIQRIGTFNIKTFII